MSTEEINISLISTNTLL